jgi:PKD repeat protein
VTGDLVSRFAATPLAGKAPLAVRFEDRSIGGPTKWAWDFNDGAISNVQNPVHTFAEPGSYTVKLTINRNDVSASFTQIVNVGGVPNTDFSASPLAVNVNEPITFTDKTTNNPTSWKWDFGDAAETTLQNPTHAYQVKGIYTVSLATRNDNGRDTEIKKNYINVGMGPKADFRPVIAMYQQYYVPLRVVFIDQSLSNPTSWTWDFGDGITSTEQNPAHLYAKAGTYTVALTVKNSFGQDTMTKKDCIVVGGGAAVDFSASPTVVGVGRYVTFTDLSANNPTAWVWDFGDGTTGSGANPDHAYVSVGTYDVTLTASNIGQSNSMTRNKYITVINIPRADFTTDKIRGGAPMTVQFTDKSSGAPVSWKWDFGDGGSSIEQNPKHTYSTLGTYTVSLTVSNKDGSDTTTKVNLIATTLAPVADFKADRQVGKAPFIVTFTDISTNNPTAWSWDFGDGTSSSEQNPRHIYLREGAYDVSLTATNQYGSDKAFKTGTAATAAGTVTQTPAVAPITTVSVQVAGEGAKATSTKAPLSPIVTLIGAITGMAAIVFVSRK